MRIKPVTFSEEIFLLAVHNQNQITVQNSNLRTYNIACKLNKELIYLEKKIIQTMFTSRPNFRKKKNRLIRKPPPLLERAIRVTVLEKPVFLIK